MINLTPYRLIRYIFLFIYFQGYLSITEQYFKSTEMTFWTKSIWMFRSYTLFFTFSTEFTDNLLSKSFVPFLFWLSVGSLLTFIKHFVFSIVSLTLWFYIHLKSGEKQNLELLCFVVAYSTARYIYNESIFLKIIPYVAFGPFLLKQLCSLILPQVIFIYRSYVARKRNDVVRMYIESLVDDINIGYCIHKMVGQYIKPDEIKAPSWMTQSIGCSAIFYERHKITAKKHFGGFFVILSWLTKNAMILPKWFSGCTVLFIRDEVR